MRMGFDASQIHNPGETRCINDYLFRKTPEEMASHGA
jgi:hypothetical protein